MKPLRGEVIPTNSTSMTVAFGTELAMAYNYFAEGTNNAGFEKKLQVYDAFWAVFTIFEEPDYALELMTIENEDF